MHRIGEALIHKVLQIPTALSGNHFFARCTIYGPAVQPVGEAFGLGVAHCTITILMPSRKCTWPTEGQTQLHSFKHRLNILDSPISTSI